MTRLLVITDNRAVKENFEKAIADLSRSDITTTYACTWWNKDFVRNEELGEIRPINIRKETDKIVASFDVVFSAHCKQLFPAKLFERVRCYNLHPGFNPYNRGWYPQVFSILNGYPCGATLHEIDGQLDHGKIIDQEEVRLTQADTSYTAYSRIIDAERRILARSLEATIDNSYESCPASSEGNLNLKSDFDELCCLNLEEQLSMGEAIDRLRALSHGDFLNAWFLGEMGKKIYLRLELFEESQIL